jgi:nucleoside-diphosphate-sugar epimerase
MLDGHAGSCGRGSSPSRSKVNPSTLFKDLMSIPKAKKPLNIAVLGPAGFGGSYLCVELINRVNGFSRSPETLGSHKLYIPISLDLEKGTIDELAEAFKGHDVAIEYSYNFALAHW